MNLFKYLEREEFAETWVNGGIVPISLASTYRAVERNGNSTPDEVLQQKFSGYGMPQLLQSGIVGVAPDFMGTATLHNVTFAGHPTLSRPLTVNGSFRRAEEDGLVDCHATVLDRDLMRKLGKSCAVEVTKVEGLWDNFDEQIGHKSIRRPIRYVRGMERGHFAKSRCDSWQHEFRAVWVFPNCATVEVSVPAGFCRRVM